MCEGNGELATVVRLCSVKDTSLKYLLSKKRGFYVNHACCLTLDCSSLTQFIETVDASSLVKVCVNELNT